MKDFFRKIPFVRRILGHSPVDQFLPEIVRIKVDPRQLEELYTLHCQFLSSIATSREGVALISGAVFARLLSDTGKHKHAPAAFALAKSSLSETTCEGCARDFDKTWGFGIYAKAQAASGDGSSNVVPFSRGGK